MEDHNYPGNGFSNKEILVQLQNQMHEGFKDINIKFESIMRLYAAHDEKNNLRFINVEKSIVRFKAVMTVVAFIIVAVIPALWYIQALYHVVPTK